MRRRFTRNTINRAQSFPIEKVKRILLLFLIAGILVILIRFISANLAIKDLKVTGDNLNCVSSDDLAKSIKAQINNGLFINNSSIEKNIKEKYYCVLSIDIKRVGVGRIETEVKQRTPIAKVIKIEPQNLDYLVEIAEATASSEAAALIYPDFSIKESSESSSFIMDPQGMLFARNVENEGLPLIYFAKQDLSIGKIIFDGKAAEIVKLIDKVKLLGLEISTVKVEGDKILIDTKPKLVFGLGRDLNIQFASLQLILQKAKMNSGEISATNQKNKQIEMINLRFDKPVVRYSP